MEHIGGIEDHRGEREAGGLVYPVISRRSGGLSLGINLFPEAKICNFDCPYCEVFPFPAAAPVTALRLVSALESFLVESYPASWAPEPIRDLCISGNGEPCLSPLLEEAVLACSTARRRHPELLGGAKTVLISNATGFLVQGIAEILHRCVAEEGLEIWAKLDGGDEESFARMSRSPYSHSDIVRGIRSFSAKSSVVIQTMLCEVEGRRPGTLEFEAYAGLLGSFVSGGCRIAGVQLYTLARPCPEALCASLSDTELSRFAGSLRARIPLPLRAFGARGELPPAARDR